VAALVIGLFALGWYYGNKTVKPTRAELEQVEQKMAVLRGPSSQVSAEKEQINKALTSLNEMSGWVNERFLWFDILNNLHEAMIETEKEVSANLTADMGREVKAGLWIDQFLPELPDMETGLEDPLSNEGGASSASLMRASRGRRVDPRMSGRYARLIASAAEVATDNTPVNTNEIREIKVICKGVNLKQQRITANDELAFKFEEKVKGMTNLFDPAETSLSAQSEMTNAYANTFSFTVKLKLKTPVKI
ncbi:MAG: hypothetical protein J6W90_07635, partial [Verrucomicrobia bacterium]|nr:hypothetical protein [Verrucomicrobiota bacterium]